MLTRRDALKFSTTALAAIVAALLPKPAAAYAETDIALPVLINGTLHFGAGIYNLSAPLDASLCPIAGEGPGVTILGAPAGQPAIQWVNNAGQIVGPVNVRELTIRGTNMASRGIFLDGFKDAGSDRRINEIHISQVHFEWCDIGLQIDQCVNIWLTNCKAIACNKGFSLKETADVHVTGCKTQLCNIVGTELKGAGAHEVWSEGTHLGGLVDNGSSTGIIFDGYDYVWLTGCSFSSARANAVIGINSHNINWTGGEASNTRERASGIVLDSNCRRWSVGNIFIDNCTEFGIVLRGAFHNFSKITFANLANNVPAYLECTDSQLDGLIFENCPKAWTILEAGPANRNRVFNSPPPAGGSIVLVGPQSKMFNCN